VFWVISVYFNIRNTLPKSGTFLLGHPVYIYIYILFMPTSPSQNAGWRRLYLKICSQARYLGLFEKIFF